MDMVLVSYRQAVFAHDADGNTPLELAKEGEYDERDEVISVLQNWESVKTTSSTIHTTTSASSTGTGTGLWWWVTSTKAPTNATPSFRDINSGG